MEKQCKYQQAWSFILFLILKTEKMKKLLLIHIYLFLIIFVQNSSAQLTDSNILNDNEFVKNNKFAVVFELGSIVGSSSIFERYNLLAKYHMCENFAVRSGFDYGKSLNEPNYENPSVYTDFSTYSYDVYADLQYYLTKKTFVQPFVTVGSIYSKDHYYSMKDNKDELFYYDEWHLGITASLGTEIFLKNNVSLIAEYIAKCSYVSELRERVSNGYLDYRAKLRNIKFSYNTARVGFSVYF